MNRRIDDLSIEAAEYADMYFDDNTDAWMHCYSDKFAELIILGCEKVAKNPKWYDESPSNGWRNPINHVCKEIKEHFGVK